MAATNRLFVDFISGTIDSELDTSSDTTISGSFLSDLPVVSDPDFVALIIDPEEENNPSEVVWVTAHSASATTATIEAGKEGTSNATHPSGTKVVAALTADAVEEIEADIATAQTAADDAQADADSHASRHAIDGADPLTEDFPLSGGDFKSSAVSLAGGGTDVLSASFTLPSSWSSALIIAWGETTLTKESGSDGSVRADLEVGSSSATLVFVNVQVDGLPATGDAEVWARVTGNTTVKVTGSDRIGDGADLEAAAENTSVGYIAIQLS